MSGLSQIQFGFENPLKMGFEKFEKEKEKGNFLLRAHYPAAQCSAYSGGHFFSSPAPRLWFLGPSPTTASWPVFARAAVSRTESLTC
jgi:hypothetical protein